MFEQFEHSGVIAGMQARIDLLDQLGSGFDAGLLIAALLQTFDFKLQPGILAINGSQDFPIVERITKGSLLFVQVGARDDRVYEIALILHEVKSTFKMCFTRMLLQGLTKNTDAFIKVRLRFNLTIDLRNQRRQILPLLLFDVIAESLKNRIGG